jgi:5-methylcytosine-specific restriction enzyme subunit McrC
LLEALIFVFSERLLTELRLGLDHAYMLREENAGFVRGKLQLREHLIRNVGHKERVFVAFDEFVSDTPLNRILKRTCQVLAGRIRSHAVERNLRAALLAFDGVQDVEIRGHHFAQVQLTRSSERFEVLMEFCRIVLLDGAPSSHVGESSTFSLLFPMERVFERFVARAMLRNVSRLELDAGMVAVQGRGSHRWLVSDGSKGRFRLRPDIVVHGDLRPRLLIDTKWKRLLSDDQDQKNGVSQADMYQMVAYSTAYDCDDNVLLFPRVSGAKPKRYVLQGGPKPRTIRIEFIDLSRDLWTHREELVADLQRVVGAASNRGDRQDYTARFDEAPGHG